MSLDCPEYRALIYFSIKLILTESIVVVSGEADGELSDMCCVLPLVQQLCIVVNDNFVVQISVIVYLNST